MYNRVIFGDSRRMNLVDDKSIHLIVTSPPYWQIKDYGIKEQIGYNDTYDEYINNLNLVWQECYRVLHDGCKLCINIGDQYTRTSDYGRYKVLPIFSEIIRFCETIGFDYMGDILWQKVSTMHTSGGAVIMGSYPYPRNGIIKMGYEHLLLFKKNGNDTPLVTEEQREKSKLTSQEWNDYFTSQWTFCGQQQKEHIAMFPEELPKRLIKMFSFTDETILDPFLGSGTTMKVANQLNRNAIGYEINEKYKATIRNKINSLWIDAQTYFVKDTNTSWDYSHLPYIYNGANIIEKKKIIQNENK